MKCIRALDGPTPGLVDYVDCDGEQANWDGFRSHQAGDAYLELVSALQNVQHGLCGYCEIDVTDQDRQVEHVIPQSNQAQGAILALDATNMIVCCKGGTWQTADVARWRPPPKRNRSCGEAKQDSVDPDFVDPRMLPALPSLTRVRFDGRIAADNEACVGASFDAGKVDKTIDILGLNVERLRLAREKRWQALSENWQEYLDDPQVMQKATRMELLPAEGGRLSRFFSTSRSFFGPVAELVLAEPPQAWI